MASPRYVSRIRDLRRLRTESLSNASPGGVKSGNLWGGGGGSPKSTLLAGGKIGKFMKQTGLEQAMKSENWLF